MDPPRKVSLVGSSLSPHGRGVGAGTSKTRGRASQRHHVKCKRRNKDILLVESQSYNYEGSKAKKGAARGLEDWGTVCGASDSSALVWWPWVVDEHDGGFVAVHCSRDTHFLPVCFGQQAGAQSTRPPLMSVSDRRRCSDSW